MLFLTCLSLIISFFGSQIQAGEARAESSNFLSPELVAREKSIQQKSDKELTVSPQKIEKKAFSSYCLTYVTQWLIYVWVVIFFSILVGLSHSYSSSDPYSTAEDSAQVTGLWLSLFLFPLVYAVLAYQIDVYRQKKELTRKEFLFRSLMVFLLSAFVSFFSELLLLEAIYWILCKKYGADYNPLSVSLPLSFIITILYYAVAPIPAYFSKLEMLRATNKWIRFFRFDMFPEEVVIRNRPQ